MVDLKKSFGYSKKSMLLVIAIWLVATILGYTGGMVPSLGFLAAIGLLLGTLQFFVLNPILFGYAGYRSSKEGNGGLVDGAATGAMAGFASSLVISVVSMALLLVFAVQLTSATENSAGSAALLGGIAMIGQIIGLMITTGVGLLFGLIGSVVYDYTKKK